MIIAVKLATLVTSLAYNTIGYITVVRYLSVCPSGEASARLSSAEAHSCPLRYHNIYFSLSFSPSAFSPSAFLTLIFPSFFSFFSPPISKNIALLVRRRLTARLRKRNNEEQYLDQVVIEPWRQ